MSGSLRHCAVSGCDGIASDGSRNILHQVPQDAGLRKAWLLLIGKPLSEKRLSIYVCGRHFSADAYNYNPDVIRNLGVPAKLCLRKGVLPTLFLPTLPPHAKHQAPKSQSCPAPSSGSSSEDLPLVAETTAAHHCLTADVQCAEQCILQLHSQSCVPQAPQNQTTSAAAPCDKSSEVSPLAKKCQGSSHPVTSAVATQTASILHTVSAQTSSKLMGKSAGVQVIAAKVQVSVATQTKASRAVLSTT
ncbi:hypothetical protein V5799_019776 [Amblyomma americanum]|uniref:THAP-type domain-containing protein n=1 Tax=Amblyomma americanum TaxID=6943 RepID=A0AAQ4EVX9_AMBAM